MSEDGRRLPGRRRTRPVLPTARRFIGAFHRRRAGADTALPPSTALWVGGQTGFRRNVSAPGIATIWWTPTTPGFVLQSTDSLSPTNWVNAPSGTNNPATVPATLPARFYRLFKP